MATDRIEVEVEIDVGRGHLGVWPVEHFCFPGGEVQASIPDIEPGDERIVVVARLASAEGLVKLLLTTEVLDRIREGRRSLALPYFPYAQQDRVMDGREAFSLRPIARLINGMGYDRVAICDPHSDVTPALLDRARTIPQHEIVARHPEMIRALRRDDALIVSPDAGAAKKAAKVAAHFGREMVCGTKVRDTSDGNLSRIELPEAARASGKRAVIVDDICVGGATFTALAGTLREAGARHVLLYVTHGIFSKGLDPFVGLVDWILTTDTHPACPERGNGDIPLYRFSVDGLIRSALQ